MSMAKKRFSGEQVDVDWDGRLCIHVAECGRAKGELFVGGREPWAQPDLVPLQEVIDVVERCPTGALTYEVKDGSVSERPAEENTVTVSCHGPYFLRGEINLEGTPTDMDGTRFRAALCRCGSSRRKPFCDNSHEQAGFKDAGAVGEKGDAHGGGAGELSVKPLPDGPLLVSGNFSIIAGSGRVAWHGTQAALCRCGASKNKPFCDGSHTGMGFKSGGA